MRVEPSKPRYTTSSEAGVLTVACPPRRNWLILLFLMAWLGAWTVGGISALGEVTKPGEHQAFMVFWLVAWAVGELWVLVVVLWQLAGLEELLIAQGNLVHRASIAGIGRTREFAGAEVKNLRSSPQMLPFWMDQSSFTPPIFGSGHGAIAFDYGAKTYRVGSGLDEAEARQIVATLSKQYPRMAEAPSAT
jgi:hypothetical protein